MTTIVATDSVSASKEVIVASIAIRPRATSSAKEATSAATASARMASAPAAKTATVTSAVKRHRATSIAHGARLAQEPAPTATAPANRGQAASSSAWLARVTLGVEVTHTAAAAAPTGTAAAKATANANSPVRMATAQPAAVRVRRVYSSARRGRRESQVADSTIVRWESPLCALTGGLLRAGRRALLIDVAHAVAVTRSLESARRVCASRPPCFNVVKLRGG